MPLPWRPSSSRGGERAPCRWIAVHHGRPAGGNEHIHLMVSLVREDGELASTWNDRRTMSRVCADMECLFDLVVVEGRTGHGMPGYSKAEHQRMRAGAIPERQRLARDLRRRRAAAAPAWTERRYGAVSDTRLAQLATVAADDLARLSSPQPDKPVREERT